jgi:hypothetical protein
MPVQEALELIEALEARSARGPELVLVNGLYPEPEPGEPARAAADSVLELWLERRRVNERELERLRTAWSGPRVALPLLALERGPALVAALEERLEAGLGAAP